MSVCSCPGVPEHACPLPPVVPASLSARPEGGTPERLTAHLRKRRKWKRTCRGSGPTHAGEGAGALGPTAGPPKGKTPYAREAEALCAWEPAYGYLDVPF